MSSVFDTEKSISIKYDLKGSTIGRLTSEKDCAAGAVQKDLNLMRAGKGQLVMHYFFANFPTRS